MNPTENFVLRWYNRLLFRMSVAFLLLFAVLIAAIVLAMEKVGKARLEEQAYRLVTQTGNTIVADVYSRTVFAESLAKVLANLGEQLPLDVASHMAMASRVMDLGGRNRLSREAGSGPSPINFQKILSAAVFSGGGIKPANYTIMTTITTRRAPDIIMKNGMFPPNISATIKISGPNRIWTPIPISRW